MEGYDVIYYWYDHLLLRKNGDANKVQQAIKNHDFATFMDFYNKYSANNYDGLIFFPEHASIFSKASEEIIGWIDVTTKEGFNLIDDNEYECG
jgi:hypothetical protein